MAMLLAVAAIVVLLAGCGGEGGSASGDDAEGFTVRASTTITTASPRITRAQFVAQVNKICRKAWVVVLDNFAQYSSWQDPKEGSKRDRFAEAVVLSFLAGIDFHIFDEIQNLGSAPGEENDIEAIIGPFQRSVELGQQEHWSAYSPAEIPAQFDEYNQRARQYGLDDCLIDAAHVDKLEA